MEPLIKNPFYFYKVLTSNWNVSMFEPNWIISLQIAVNSVKLLLQIFKTMEKSEFSELIKHCFLMGKILFKHSNGLISVVRTLFCRKRWYAEFKRGVRDTNGECSGRPNSAVCPRKHQKLHKIVLVDRKLKLCEIAE